MKFTPILNALNNAQNIAIFTHINPDADCLGSAIALGGYLRHLGKNVNFFCDDIIHENFKIIVGNEFDNKYSGKYDLVVAVDSSELNRLGEYAKVFSKHKNTINIDHHHIFNTNFAKYNYVDGDVVSASQIIYNLIKESGVKLNDMMAKGIYAGVIGDTGGLSYGNLNSEVFLMISELVKYNIQIDDVSYYLLRRRTPEQIMLLQKALSSIVIKGQLATMVLTMKDFEQTNTSHSDVFSFVNYAINIDGVELAVCLCEYLPNRFMVSFRSKGLIDASQVAKVFGGGGHFKASGCRVFGKLNKCLAEIEKAVGQI